MHSSGDYRPVLLFAVVVVLGAVLLGSVGGASSAVSDSPPSADSAHSSQPENATIEGVSFTGEAVTNTSDGRRVVWQEGSFDATVRYQPTDRTRYTVCAWTGTAETEVCEEISLGDPQNRTSVTFAQSGWPTDTTGPQNVTVEFRASEQTLAEHTREIVVLERNESYDGDALSNGREIQENSSVFKADTDEDGLNDGVEIRTHGTDPTDPDSDDDGLRDGREVELGTEPNNSDSDDDGLQDGREVELGTDPTDSDTDEDGLQDGREVELDTDPTEADSDEDGLEDPRELEIGSDPTDPDSDEDGLQDGREVDVGTDPTEADTDGDGLSDGTEVTLGTNPTSATTPFTLAIGVLVAVAVVGLLVARRLDSVDVAWWTNDRVPFAIPVLSRTSDPDASDERPPEPSRESSQAVESEPQWTNVAEQPINPNRETVLSFLQTNDGRVRQNDIVEETDWSAAKVSRTLSAMEDDEQVRKVTIGRENIVTLDGEEPSPTSFGEDASVSPTRGGQNATAGANPTSDEDESDARDVEAGSEPSTTEED